MIDFTKLFPTDLYHSYIIESNENNIIFDLCDFLEKRGDIEVNNKDILCQTYDSFSIADSSVIKEWHSESSISKKRICIIKTNFINHDAERTLLKMIEEPASVSYTHLTLPTTERV